MRPAKPEVFFVIQEVAGAEAFEGNPKRKQGLKGGVGVFECGSDEEVEIMGGPHLPVRVDRHAAHDGVLNSGGGERG